jgi:hypothetical protein
MCGAGSVQSVSPKPLKVGKGPHSDVLLPQSGSPTGAGMVVLGHELRNINKQ